MKRYFLLLLIFPLIAVSQKRSPDVKTEKPASLKPAQNVTPVLNGFTISGTASGFSDGTVVDLMNGYNGQPEASTIVQNGKFSFAGIADPPVLKLIAFNKQAPFISFFTGNHNVAINVSKENIMGAQITGSPVNNAYVELSDAIRPYEYLFVPNAAADAVTLNKATGAIEGFVKKNSNSHVAPLAIIKHFQLSADGEKMDELFTGLSADLKTTPIGLYIEQEVAKTKLNPLGKVLPDFSQADTSGNAVSLSSLKGKYVLVDFWASWCGPCRQENPNLVSAYHKYKNKNFIVFGVSLDKSRQPWIDAIKKDKLTWPHVSDLKGWQNAVAQQFQIFSIPQNFLLDPSGKVIAKNLRGADLERKLESLLK